nr:hypothetical protein [Tanacetum cinerariifolium]
MDDSNITMKEYIRLEEEKARKHGKVFNMKTDKYGKIWYDEDVHDLRSVKTEFPAIVFNDHMTSNETLFCEPLIIRHFLWGLHRTKRFNVPLELRRDQVDDLMPTIEEGEVVEEFRARNDARMKMDAYHDEGMGDVIFGKPCLREVGINTRRFEGMITIYNGNEKVTYQMVRSHPMFKHHNNEQCNKISPLIKISEEDMMNGISHSYQKLKSFYKAILNLGTEYVRDAKMKEWLKRGHISVHEMK